MNDDVILAVLENLSDREREVLEHLGDGHTYAAIARRMQLSVHTVDTYLRRIRAKTGAVGRGQLVLYAWLSRRQDGLRERGNGRLCECMSAMDPLSSS